MLTNFYVPYFHRLTSSNETKLSFVSWRSRTVFQITINEKVYSIRAVQFKLDFAPVSYRSHFPSIISWKKSPFCTPTTDLQGYFSIFAVISGKQRHGDTFCTPIGPHLCFYCNWPLKVILAFDPISSGNTNYAVFGCCEPPCEVLMYQGITCQLHVLFIVQIWLIQT